MISGLGGSSQLGTVVPPTLFTQQPILRLSVVLVGLKLSTGLARKYFHFGGYGTASACTSLALKVPTYVPGGMNGTVGGLNGQTSTK